MSERKTFPVTFSDGTTRYFLSGKAAIRYARKHGLTLRKVRGDMLRDHAQAAMDETLRVLP